MFNSNGDDAADVIQKCKSPKLCSRLIEAINGANTGKRGELKSTVIETHSVGGVKKFLAKSTREERINNEIIFKFA